MTSLMRHCNLFWTVVTIASLSNSYRDIIRGSPDVKWESIKGLENAKRLLKEAVVMPIKYPKQGYFSVKYIVCYMCTTQKIFNKIKDLYILQYQLDGFFHLNIVLITLAAKLKKTHVYRYFLNIFFTCYLYLYTFMIRMTYKVCLINL